MDGLDDRFESVRKKYEEAIESDDLDKQMLDMMLKSKGTAERVSQGSGGDPSFIPAGINLGGYSMMRLQDSILFFHRMKLRNNTHFRVDALHNDFSNMVLTAKLSLNDLHILGAYERVLTESDPSELFYKPTFGEVEEYEKEKYLSLNDYTDQVLEKMKKRLRDLSFEAVQIPKFTVTAVTGIATYNYEAVFNTGVPPVNGVLFVTAHELIAHMGIVLNKNPETLKIIIDSIEHVKPESITVEGPANRIIGNLKNLLERHVFTFISNAIIHNVKMISTITECEPKLIAFNHEEHSRENKENTDSENENELNHKTEVQISEIPKQTKDSESNEILNDDKNDTTNFEITIDKFEGDAASISKEEEIENENRSNMKPEDVESIKGQIDFSHSDENHSKSDKSASADTSETKINKSVLENTQTKKL
ncbi:PREDICTED: uncharacterized protein LOC106108422 [Papilio polytes]|uniref:uncharacterized protein LOC106108422 n=1 Tax=Papilio polytes TaxID=76194 RepID=UPI0006769080|nr:PREDICTED: uncharacterized protein LOC106108422 [Papilio polytes]